MRHEAQFERIAGDLDGDEREFFRRHLQQQTKRENERMWALYRETELSQEGVAEVVIPDADIRPGQSQVSRIINQVDARILTKCYELDDRHDEKHGKSLDPHNTSYQFLKLAPSEANAMPESLADAFKDLVAEVIVRRRALQQYTDATTEPDEWAREFVPDEVAENATEIRAEMYSDLSYLRDDENLSPTLDIRQLLNGDSAAGD